MFSVVGATLVRYTSALYIPWFVAMSHPLELGLYDYAEDAILRRIKIPHYHIM